MKNLIIDCSLGMNVYLDNEGVIKSKVDYTQNKHTDEILKVIDELLNQVGLKINQIQNICVCVGPGSFTGVRVAISIAKGLAMGTKAKVFSLSNFDIFKFDDNINYCLVLDGFSDFVYARTNINGEVLDRCIEIENLTKEIKTYNLTTYITTEKTQTKLKNYEIQSKFANNDIISAFNNKINSNESILLNEIYPVYLRASQAEIERAKKNNYGKY